MTGAKQRALPMRPIDCGKRIKEEKRAELVRLLAELLLQAFKSEETKDGGAVWKR